MNNMNIKEYNVNNINSFSVKKEKKVKAYVADFNFNNFVDFQYVYKKLSSNFKLGNRHTILARVGYVKRNMGMTVTKWKMLGDQIALLLDVDDNLLLEIESLHKTISSRLKQSQDIYDYKDFDIVQIQIIIYRIGSYTSEFKKNKFTKNSLGEHKDLVNYSKMSEGFNKILPLTNNKNDFGTLLNKTVIDNSVEYVTLIDGTNINIVDRINKYLVNNKKINKFSSDVDFYQKKLGESDLIIIVQDSTENDIKKSYIGVYDVSGMKIQNMVDEKIDLNTFSRKIGNVKCYINNTGIFKKEIKITFPHIYAPRLKGRYTKMLHPDLSIGTMDLETYQTDKQGFTYAAGFYVNNSVQTFYIDKDLNSDSVIMKCLNAMLVEKYNGYTFYIHNFENFDVYFILPVLLKVINLYPDKYDFSLSTRDGKIIAMKISIKLNNKTYSIKLVDSYNLLQSKLDKLCKTFNTNVKKSIFPYGFVNKNNLFYLGNKPHIEYYKDIDIDVDDKDKDKIIEDLYNQIPKENWSVEDQTISYLKNDLISLYQVMETFIRNVYINYHTHVTRSLTISGLSMDIFLRRYYNNNIPLIKEKSIYNDIKNSYYGGITEVYKPYGKNLYYYDVNSLYPYSALNSMPGLNCVYIDNINQNIAELIDSLFGFYYCKIITSNNYIGLLPFRSDQGLIMPLGEIEGWYFSEELKFAYEHGYKIDIISGYNFDKSENVFKEYIEELYKIKSTSKDEVERSIAKSELNNLLGRFGMDINKYVTEILSENEAVDIGQTRRLRSVDYIFDDKVLVSYDREISLDICKKYGIDYRNIFSDLVKSKKMIKEEGYQNVSIAIASAVTSYSRIHMNKVKLDILNKGGSIYYTDTDSIITDIKLDDSQVGNEIGKFKLVHEIEEAYFISNKTYALKQHDGKIITKNKGVYSKSLNYNHFIDLYLGKDVKATRYESIKDLSKASVAIKIPNPITLSANSYTKRAKIFNKKNLWIDTKPLNISSKKYHSYIYIKKKFRSFLIDYKIKDVLINILIGILICVPLIMSYILSDFNNDDLPLDLDKAENMNKDNIVYLTNSINTNRDSDIDSVPLFRQKLNKFINLFSKDKNVNISYNIFKESIVLDEHSKKDIKVCEENKLHSQLENEKSIILGKIKDLHLESANSEIINLNEKISLLEIDLINQKIDKLNLINEIKSIIIDLEKKKQNCTKLDRNVFKKKASVIVITLAFFFTYLYYRIRRFF